MHIAADQRAVTVAVARASGQPFTIEPAYIRAPRSDEVLVKVVATGMCHTDLIVRDQYYPVPLPAVLGHEGAGVVEALGPDVKNLKIGDHVVLTYGACGHCAPCLSGHETYCKTFYAHNFGGTGPDGDIALQSPDGKPLHDHFSHSLRSPPTRWPAREMRSKYRLRPRWRCWVRWAAASRPAQAPSSIR